MYRILIVDDEKNERDCILYLLKNCGFELEIKEAEDGVEALQILKIWPAIFYLPMFKCRAWMDLN